MWMSVIQTREAVQTTVATAQAPTAVTADSMLTWTQMEDTARADQGSYRMMLHSLVMVSKNWTMQLVLIWNLIRITVLWLL